MTSTRRVRAVLLAVGLAVAGTSTACSAAQPAATRASAYPAPTGHPQHPGDGASAVAGARAVAARHPARAEAPGVAFSRVRTPDGSVITIATFRGPVRYVLHDGSADPGALAGPVTAGPKITGPSRALLLAAFNGGFKMTSLAGGYEQEGHVARPLRRGLASLVIDRSGQARIDGTRHQPGVGPAGRRDQARRRAGGRSARSAPSGRSVPRRLDQGLHRRPRPASAITRAAPASQK